LLPSWYAQGSGEPDERPGTGLLPNSAKEQGILGGVVGLLFFLSFTHEEGFYTGGGILQYGGSRVYFR